MNTFEPDYIVGSVHFVADMGFDYSKEQYDKTAEAVGGLDALYCEYFDLQYEMIEFLKPAVVCHFDLIRIFDPEYKGLINFFHVLLYQIEAKEFLEIIGNAISEDSSKLAKAKKRFEELVREAKQMKEEFENYKEEEDIDSDDDEGLDDFLSGLGISRPK